MTEPHYRLSDTDTIVHMGRDLRRVICISRDHPTIYMGCEGGYVEHERNLKQGSNAWVGEDARVYASGIVRGDAHVCGHATIHGGAVVQGDAVVYGNAVLTGSCVIEGQARIHGNVVIDKMTPIWRRSDGYYFVLAKNQEDEYRIVAGCRYFSFSEAWDHWRNHSRKYGSRRVYEETLTILKGFEDIARRPLRQRIADRFF